MNKPLQEPKYTEGKELNIKEADLKLSTIHYNGGDFNLQAVLDALAKDDVVLIRGVDGDNANALIERVCQGYDLGEALSLQAAFASSLGHRDNVGEYYMTVNRRKDYQFITPHSEGGSFSDMQLAAYYCFENSTDGGESIFLHVDSDSDIWQSDTLKERISRGKATRELTPGEKRKVRSLFRINMPEDTLREEDVILSEDAVSPLLTVYDVLAKPVKSYSRILDKEMFVYWDTIEALDGDSPRAYAQLLKKSGLLRSPNDSKDTSFFDEATKRRVTRFGDTYDRVFDFKVTHKLVEGDLVIHNNLTYAHSVSNWTPTSGVRNTVVAFA